MGSLCPNRAPSSAYQWFQPSGWILLLQVQQLLWEKLYAHYPPEAFLKLKFVLQGDYNSPQGCWGGGRLQRNAIALRGTILLLHFFHLRLQPGLTVWCHELTTGLQGLRCCLISLAEGGSARSSAATSSLSSWLSLRWELQHVLCALAPKETQTQCLEFKHGFTACFVPSLHWDWEWRNRALWLGLEFLI